MRHREWVDVMVFLDNIAERFGGSVWDKRCNKSWDVGQAVCAEAYGPDWKNALVFLAWDKKDDSEPPEPHYYYCAKRMAEGYVPEWIKIQPENPADTE